MHHDPGVRDQVARWQVLRKAGAATWDHLRGGSGPPEYAPLVRTLVEAGHSPDVVDDPEHDVAQQSLRQHAGAWSDDEAAAAFVAGLWSAPAAWRSALPGLLVARAMPVHPLVPWNEDASLCEVCGFRAGPVQLVDEWASRLTEGTPLDGEPSAYGRTLAWLGRGRPGPTEHDRWALGAVLEVLATVPDGTRYAAAAKAIAAAGVLRSRRAAVAVLEDLALVGVLARPDRPGMVERFTTYRERDQRPTVRVEVQAPLAWWDTTVGDHGVRRDLFDGLFGGLDVPAVSLDGPRPTPSPAAKDTIDGGLAGRAQALAPRAPRISASVGAGPPAPGDVWAVRVLPGRWVTLYVHEVADRGGRPYARTEFLAGVHPALPELEDVSGTVQPRADGRAPTWAHSLGTTSWTRRIGQVVPVPAADRSLPDGGSWVAAKELRHLSGWHFPDA
ncbi:hypothetical protein [Sanguibacter suaedae]|uniref:Uncharacterized protein n=1 Tax=Sanguibacter suaedae TaxID=2795737 RepID=A0A934MCZ0_9MICO|nr:hypothetical protein [Sanguibacter suaedae]MBI9114314.1 hypothetical protein [Sanguibacter suaedae]